MSKLSREQVLKLARLSKLILTDEEIERYQNELSTILDYVERLKEVDVTGLKPTYQVTGLVNVTRKDVTTTQQAKPEVLLANAPKTKDQYIQVGRMI